MTNIDSIFIRFDHMLNPILPPAPSAYERDTRVQGVSKCFLRSMSDDLDRELALSPAFHTAFQGIYLFIAG
jgi:hypothetical protein